MRASPGEDTAAIDVVATRKRRSNSRPLNKNRTKAPPGGVQSHANREASTHKEGAQRCKVRTRTSTEVGGAHAACHHRGSCHLGVILSHRLGDHCGMETHANGLPEVQFVDMPRE